MTRDETISMIAQRILRVDTLETRNRDALDFYDLGVASIREALEAAFDAGMTAGIEGVEATAGNG